MRARKDRETRAHLPEGTLVAIAGGKDVRDPGAVFARLDTTKAKYPDMVLAHGGGPGVEKIAARWADRQLAAALHQDLGHPPVERQRLQDAHSGAAVVAVGGRRGHDQRARHRHGELGQLRVAGEEGRCPDRLPGIVDVDRHLVGHRPGRRGKRRVAPAVGAAAMLRGGVVREDALAGADRGADRGRRPVVLRPERADQRLGGLARVEVLAVDPLRQRPELRHGLGDHRRDRLQGKLEGEPDRVLGDRAGERHKLVGVDERKGPGEGVDAAAARPEGGQARRGDGEYAERQMAVDQDGDGDAQQCRTGNRLAEIGEPAPDDETSRRGAAVVPCMGKCP